MVTRPRNVRPWCFRAVIFDMDGVVIDSHPAHREAWLSFLRTLNREVCDKELDYILDGRKREDILRHFLGDISPDQLCRYGQQKDMFFKKQMWQVRPMPGLVELLSDLQSCQVPLAVATSASAKRTYSTLRQLGLRDYFDTIITANDVTASKPDPAIYRLACERLCVSPPEALAIEDAYSGVVAASTAGLRCVGIAVGQDGENLRKAGATVVLHDSRDLTMEQLEEFFQRDDKRFA